MLKQTLLRRRVGADFQPPLGGCVLKPQNDQDIGTLKPPAAFRRLCVETKLSPALDTLKINQPPLGGCVLKL